jgi:hypothetical protein
MNKMNQQVNRAKWEGHVIAWSRSELTQSAYCREHGLLPKLFSAWVGRVKRSSAELSKPLTMVPVVVERHGGHDKFISPISLQHQSGWQLQLPANVAAGWLGNVLKELA